MIIAAFRYCLGRRTYVVSDCADWITQNWESFPERCQQVIRRDLDEAFAKDDAERQERPEQSSWWTLGHDCDRQEWERVRALWQP
jgi:hypothetical protein